VLLSLEIGSTVFGLHLTPMFLKCIPTETIGGLSTRGLLRKIAELSYFATESVGPFWH